MNWRPLKRSTPSPKYIGKVYNIIFTEAKKLEEYNKDKITKLDKQSKEKCYIGPYIPFN